MQTLQQLANEIVGDVHRFCGTIMPRDLREGLIYAIRERFVDYQSAQKNTTVMESTDSHSERTVEAVDPRSLVSQSAERVIKLDKRPTDELCGTGRMPDPTDLGSGTL